MRLITTLTLEPAQLAGDVPATGEVFAGYDAPAWLGLAVPQGTPEPVVARLEAVAPEAGAEPATRVTLANLGIEADGHGGAGQCRRLPITGQVMGRPIGLVLGFELPDNPFASHAAWAQVEALPFGQRVRRLRDPALRERLLTEQGEAGHAQRSGRWTSCSRSAGGRTTSRCPRTASRRARPRGAHPGGAGLEHPDEK